MMSRGTKYALLRGMVFEKPMKLSFVTILAILGYTFCGGAVHAAADAYWIQPDSNMRPGEPIEIICRIEWQSSDPALNILPAEPPSLDWGSLDLLRTESGLTEDTVQVDQVFQLTAVAAGTFRLPAVQISYTDGDSDPQPTVEARSIEIVIREFNRPLYTAAIAAGVTAILAAMIIVIRLRATKSASQSQADSGDAGLGDARSALNRARVLRADGDFYGCYQAMVEAASAIGPAQATLAAELSTRAEAAGYGGSRPDDTTLDSDLRAVDRAIAKAEARDEYESIPTETENEVAKP